MLEDQSQLEPELPSGVRTIAWLFALCGIYLGSVGALILISPGTIAMSAGAPLLFGLELAGPYMFLLTALIAGGVAFGLLKLINIVRHIAILIAIAGVVMLVPSVSIATVLVQVKALAFGGLGIIIPRNRRVVSVSRRRSRTIQSATD